MSKNKKHLSLWQRIENLVSRWKAYVALRKQRKLDGDSLEPANFWEMLGEQSEQVEFLFYTTRGRVDGHEYFGNVLTNEDHYGMQAATIYTKALRFQFLTSQEYEASWQVPLLKALARFFSPIVLQTPVEFVGADPRRQFIHAADVRSVENKFVPIVNHGVFTSFWKSAADAAYVALALKSTGAVVINQDVPTRGAMPFTYEGDVETEQAMAYRNASLTFDLMMALPDRTFDIAGHSQGTNEENMQMAQLERLLLEGENKALKAEKEALEAENSALKAELESSKKATRSKKLAKTAAAKVEPVAEPVDPLAVLRRQRLARTVKPFRLCQMLAADIYEATYVSDYHQCLMRNCEYIFGYQSSRDHLLDASVAEHMDTLDQFKLLLPASLRKKWNISVDFRNRIGLHLPVLSGLGRIDYSVTEDLVGHAFKIVIAAIVTHAVDDGNGRALEKYVGFRLDPASPPGSPLWIVEASLPNQIEAIVAESGIDARLHARLKTDR